MQPQQSTATEAPAMTADIFGMGQLSTEDFNFHVSQVMQGFEPTAGAAPAVPSVPAAKAVTATVAPAVPMVTTTTSCKNASSSDSSESTQAAVPAASAAVASGAMAGMLDAHALATGPASRRRGLAYAQHVKAVAREEFKEKRRRDLEAMGEGDRTKRRKKNDTSMTERQKYRRRLQKNQDSAAAARYAQDAYLANLEAQVEAYDTDMTKMGNHIRKVSAERDEYARLNDVYKNHTRSLEIELQHYREAIAAHTRNQQQTQTQSQHAAPDQQRIHFDQLVDAINCAPAPAATIPVAQKNRLEADLINAFDFETYHGGAPFEDDGQGGAVRYAPAA